MARNRAEVVLSIVLTDNTFDLHVERDPMKVKPPAESWVGKCIHCRTRLAVTVGGETAATIEHIMPLCAGGDPTDPRNLALACSRCNNGKGIYHDMHVGKKGRADEVVQALQATRASRWRDPVQASCTQG